MGSSRSAEKLPNKQADLEMIYLAAHLNSRINARLPRVLPVLMPHRKWARWPQLQRLGILRSAAFGVGIVFGSSFTYTSPEEGDSARAHRHGGVQTGVKRCGMRISYQTKEWVAQLYSSSTDTTGKKKKKKIVADAINIYFLWKLPWVLSTAHQ